MGKGSSGTKTTYTASPEQRQMYAMLAPMIQQMSNIGQSQLGQSGYGMPQAPTMPSMGGVLTGAGQYGIPGYDIPTYGMFGYNVPSTSSIMPTTDWWKGLAPEVKAGAWAPFGEGQNRLMETLGSSGQGGSARGGYSGATGAALGQYMADATPAYAMNLWNMSAPGAMAGWQANLGQNQYLAGLQNQQAQWGAQAQLGENQWAAQQELARNQLGYQNQLTERQMDYQNQMNQANQNYQGQMNAWALPWGLTGMMPSTFSQGITTQPQNNMMGVLGGAGGGAATGAMIGSIFPGVGTGLGALLGGSAGLFGGMGGK
jgi:hypothetical protein